MKNKQAMKELLKDAGDLASFANANLPPIDGNPWTVPADVEKYSPLFPPSFWNAPEIKEGVIPWHYKSFQAILREAWTAGFPANLVVRLVQMPTGDINEVADFMNGTTWPYQRVIMFLFVESWRASFCPKCGKRFVKDKPNQRFCSLECFNEYRTSYKTAKARQYRAKGDK